MTRRGSHFAADHARRTRARRPLLAALVVVALALCTTGGAIAWLVSSDSLTNVFGIGAVSVTVDEGFAEGSTVKEDVKVRNDGTIPAYVRAQVNIYWVDASGNQLWDAPVARKDYELTDAIPASNGWQKGVDGFYYWTSLLDPDDTTDKLVNKLEWKTANAYDDGRHLVCDIAVQGIQSDPADAVEEAWHVTVGADSTLTINAEGE